MQYNEGERGMTKKKAPFKAGDIVITDYRKRQRTLKRKVVYCRADNGSWLVRAKGLDIDLDHRWFRRV